MINKIKITLSAIKHEMLELKEIEDSLLLAKLFYDLKNLLSYCNTDNFEIYIIENEKDIHSKYGMVYHVKDSKQSKKETLFRNLRLSHEELKLPTYIQEYERVIGIVEKEKVKLNSITKETTLESFLSNFDKKHTVNYLKYLLETELDGHGEKRRTITKV